jgi:cytoskeletal protein CcmA (bactofilin family)
VEVHRVRVAQREVQVLEVHEDLVADARAQQRPGDQVLVAGLGRVRERRAPMRIRRVDVYTASLPLADGFCHFSGRVISPTGTLIVGSGGQVDANIEVAVAQIQGSVNGDIIASQRIELGRAGKLNGNIQTPSLVIEQGGVFEGSCKMIQQKAATEKGRVDRKDPVTDTPKVDIKPDVTKKSEDGKVAAIAIAS